MFERVTDEARAVVVRAQDVARSTGGDRIEPVHLLLAVAVGEGRGATALRAAGLDAGRARTAAVSVDDAALSALGVDVGLVRERAEQTFGAGALDPRARRGHLRFAAAGKRVLREALRAELARGRHRLDDGSVLLGILEVRDAAVAAVLADQRVDPSTVRAGLADVRAA